MHNPVSLSVIARGFVRSCRDAAKKWCLTFVVLLVSLFGAVGLASPAAAQGCGYGAGGPNAAVNCWLDFSSYNDALARSADGQNFNVTLPGGYTVDFNLITRTTAGSPNVTASALPAWAPSLLGNSVYVGTPGRPALMSRGVNSGSTVTLRNIVVRDSSGIPVTGYAIVSADAEGTASNERITWTSDVPIDLVARLSPPSGSGPELGCQTDISGFGTNQVTCSSLEGTGGRYGSAVVQAVNPATFSASLTTASGGEGVAFAFVSAKLTLNKSVASRRAPTDSFDLAVTSPEGTPLGAATTGTSDTASTGPLVVMPRLNGTSYTFSESATDSTSTSLANYTQSWACTNAAVGSTTPLPGGTGTSITVSPRAADDITCTVTNTAVQPTFGTCSATMYLAQGNPTRLYQFDTSQNPFNVTPVGPVWSGAYNAVGMHPTDGYMYGLSAGLVRIGSDGSVVNLGSIANMTVGSIAGEFGPDGTYYALNGATLYRINIATRTASPLTLTQSVNVADLAWYDGKLYGAILNDSLVAIDPDSGAVTTIGPTGVTGFFGAMFGATNGVFGSNNNGGFYRFDLTTGAATLISGLQGSGTNDGAKCVNTPMAFPADTSIEKTDGSDTYVPGSDVTYTIVVSNAGPFGAQGALVNDPLPAGITDANWTCGLPVNGGVCTVASGTGAISDVPVNLPDDASVTFELTMSVPEDFAGDLVNTATVNNPSDVPDPDTGNNSSTDTNVLADPALEIEKTGTLNDLNGNDLIDSGETITYSFLVTNTGNIALEDVTVNDPLLTDAGISVTPGPRTLEPGGTATFTATYQPTQADIDSGSVENTATGTATPPDPSDPPIESPPDTVVVPPNLESGLSIVKTGTLDDLNGNELIDAGESIIYSFVVTNTGVVTLTDVTVDDPLLVAAGVDIDQDPQTLAPGESFTFTATYRPTQAEIDAGSVENTANATGTPPDPSDPPIISPPDTDTIPPNDAAGLSIDKIGRLNDLNGNNLIDPGESITYSFLVRNTGAVTLTDVTVDDPLLENAGIDLEQGPQTLAPGGSFTFTATYQPTQADIDSGEVENTATGTGTPPDPTDPPVISPPDTDVVPPNRDAGLEIEKTGTLNDANGNDLIDAGETITYSFRVTNTGTVTLTDVTVDDPLLTAAGVSLDPGPQTLAPTESVTFTATYEPSQADIDAGNVENTATATGTPPDPTDPPIESPPDTVVVPPNTDAGLEIEKTGTLNDGNGNELIDLGETITYSFLVRNTGAVTLTGVTVDDPLLTAAGVTLDQGPQTLAPGASYRFTATYQPTQADIDSGSVENTATGTGTTPDGGTIDSPPDTVVVPPNADADLEIVKTGTLNDTNGNELIDLGETISYAFVVTNTGAVTLTDVTVDDPLLTAAGIDLEQGPQTLAPGGSFTFTATYEPTQADIDAGNVENTATGTGTTPDGGTIDSPPDTVVVPPNVEPGLTIEKTGTLNDTNGNELIDLGETISYSFLVTNTGAVTITDVTVDDPLLAAAGIVLDPGPQTLAPGASATFTATYEPTQADIDSGSVENTATGTGTTPDGGTIDSPPDTVVVPPLTEPGLTIVKTGMLNDLNGNELIDLGETISYAFRVTNTGAVTITDVTVDDPLLENAGIDLEQGPQTLAPGGSFTFTATYQPTQADIDAGNVENTATATGTPPDPSDPPVESPPDTVVVPPNEEASLSIEKTGTLNDTNGNELIDAGETITYAFLVTNTGAVTLTDVTVDDPLLDDAGVTLDPGPQTLAPGESVTFTATYQPTQADIDAGNVENTATATATPPDPSDPPVESPPDTVVVPPSEDTGLTIEKTGELDDLNGNGLLDPGEAITYAFLVTNTGAVTLTDVTVDDPLLVAAGVDLDQGPQTLAPGASFTFTATYQPTPADIEAGSVENTASGTGTPPGGGDPIESPPDTVTVPSALPSLEIVKTGEYSDVDGNGATNAGDELHYTLVVTNTGNVVIEDVSPQDPGPTFNGLAGTGTFSPFTPDLVTLEPGEEQSFTAVYTLAQGDVDNGAGLTDGVENTATALGYTNGDSVTGTPVESAESQSLVSLPAAETDLSVSKVASLRYIRRGEEAPFVIRITNNSGSTAADLTVIDTLPSGFRYVEGSASIDSVEATPVVEGLRVIFEGVSVPANDQIEIRLRMLALSSAGPGEHVNRASVTDSSGAPLAPDASASVEILAEAVFDCAEIIGRVFDDRNRNGYQDEGEPGLPGVRLATVNGELITTDAHGRFSVPCAALPDQRIGSNFILKLDTRTLPTGYRLTTENPRVMRLTAGKMTEFNFGASIGRVVRLDLQDAAFEPGRTDLRPEWERGIDEVIAVLTQEQSVLRLTYIEAGGDAELAQDRLDSLAALIAERWRGTSGQYRLEIEMRVETGQ